jgi:hypothetical protein
MITIILKYDAFFKAEGFRISQVTADPANVTYADTHVTVVGPTTLPGGSIADTIRIPWTSVAAVVIEAEAGETP